MPLNLSLLMVFSSETFIACVALLQIFTERASFIFAPQLKLFEEIAIV
jgi:hypothetical protein